MTMLIYSIDADAEVQVHRESPLKQLPHEHMQV